MSGESANLLHPKRAGSSVEALVINQEPNLTSVGDSEAEWHDARSTDQLHPRAERPLDAWCVVPDDVPVEIKSAVPEHSNGGSETVTGRWYIKRHAHQRLLEVDGVYYLVVYAPVPDTPLVATQITPAARLDHLLEDKWYQCRGRDVARLRWNEIIDEDRVHRGGQL